ncbi:MAG: SIMPL domain-containing protein [Candidatus Cloacimonetes bacterium]|nr:SIMPL domain-containing protein [Candidatus Cloacimonadota bacterium]
MKYPFIIAILALLAIWSWDWIKGPKSKFNLLGIAFIIGISIFSLAFWQSRQAATSLRVVGYSSKLFESDLVKWNISLQKMVGTNELNQGYKDMSADIKAFRDFLAAQGIAPDEISVQPITSYQRYDNNGYMTGYNLSQSVFILSEDLNKIEDLALNPDFFAERGMVLNDSRLEYLYTKLPELKQELLAAATEDALARATEISGSAKTSLGKLREARAGVFQITEPYSTEVSDYGIYNTGTKQKSISVTLTAYFNLK